MALRPSLGLLCILTAGFIAAWQYGRADTGNSGVLDQLYGSAAGDSAVDAKDDCTINCAHGNRHLLAKGPGAPSIDNVGIVGAAAVLYVDVKPPTNTGGSKITACEVTGTPDDGPTAEKHLLQSAGLGQPVPGGTNLRFTFATYAKGTKYLFSVKCRNQAGFGPKSLPSAGFQTPIPGVPGPPVLSVSRDNNNNVFLTVTPPRSAAPLAASKRVPPGNGGNLPNALNLTYSMVGFPDGGATAQRPRLVLSGKCQSIVRQCRFQITGYLHNTVYRFAGSAANTAGTGPESAPRTVFYKCSKDAKDIGIGCQCKALAHCKAYNSQCACAQCQPFFSGPSCTCSVNTTGCVKKNPDKCSCETCSNGYLIDGNGGCIKCKNIDSCTMYSTVNCTCTTCQQYFNVTSRGACQCTVQSTGCLETNRDKCSCKTCKNGFKSNGEGGCAECLKKTSTCKTYSMIDCTCTECQPGYASCDANSWGCNTHVFTNSSHCGACNVTCKNGNTCQSGICKCPPGVQ